MHGIIMLGMPCSGKSSIGKEFSKQYGYRYISSGDIARQMVRYNDNIASDLKLGRMAPECEMRTKIKALIFDCMINDINFVLDGFPRFLDQYEFLQNTFQDLTLLRAHIYVSEYEALYRGMKRNRADDDAIMDRIKYYKEYTYQLTCGSDIFIDNNGGQRDAEVAGIIKLEVDKYVDRSKT